MSFEGYGLKFRKNKDYARDGRPQYSLAYKIRSADDPRHVSFSLLSALIRDKDVLLELNTELLLNSNGNSQKDIDRFLTLIASLSLKHQHKKEYSFPKKSIFGFAYQGKKKTETQKLAVYLPNAVWLKDVQDILPVCGAKYYITKSPMNAETIVNDIFTMPEEEKADAFQMVLFDLTLFGNMGISSGSLEMQELKSRLELKS